jgi:hypothetical protein
LPCYGYCGPPPSPSEAAKEAIEGAEWLSKGVAEGAQKTYEGAREGVESIISWVKGESSNENTQSEESESECGEITFGHGGRHLEGTGLSEEEVEHSISCRVLR